MSVTSPLVVPPINFFPWTPDYRISLETWLICMHKPKTPGPLVSEGYKADIACWLQNSTYNTGYENGVRETRKHALQWKYGLFYFLVQTDACVIPIFAAEPKGVPQTRLPWRTRSIQSHSPRKCEHQTVGLYSPLLCSAQDKRTSVSLALELQTRLTLSSLQTMIS
jgi:hypothetical protein